jgi:F-type H+-transporting ATPase subunit b
MTSSKWLRIAALAFVAVVALAPAVGLFAQDDHAEPAQDDHAAQEEHAEDDHGEADDHGAAGDHGDGEDHGEGEHHVAVPTPTEYVYKWINFVLLGALLYWLLVVPPAFVVENFEFEGLKVILSERSKAIVAARDLAKEQEVQAAREMEESAARLAKVEEEASALVAQARDDAQRDKTRIIEEADTQAEAIRAGASRDMRSEVARAERDLQSHVAHLAVGIATDLVKKNFSGADQDRLVREYLDRLGESVS